MTKKKPPVKSSSPEVLLKSPGMNVAVPPVMRSPLTTSTPSNTLGLNASLNS